MSGASRPDPERPDDEASLAALAAGLDAAAAQQRDALAAPAGDPSDEAALLAGFRAHVRATTAPRVRKTAVWWIAAACMLLGLLGVYALVRSGGGTSNDRPRYLGTHDVEIVAGTPFGTLRWRLLRGDPDAVRFDVRVFRTQADGTRGAPLASQRDARGGEFRVPDASLVEVSALEFELGMVTVGVAVPQFESVHQAR
ncbi:MAG: hypothetical protein U1F36_15420 [Planctomycetota bacterium]